MTANSLSHLQPYRRQPSPQQLVTRHNAVVFCGIAAASLLEHAISERADALAVAFAADAEFRPWLEEVWRPTKAAHALRARAYVEAMWPEFDWGAAADAFSDDYRRVVQPPRAAGGIAREALACSTSAAQAAAFYRGLGAGADDPELRLLLRDMAADEAAHFESFKRCYERHDRREHLGMLASYRTIVAGAVRARDVDVRLAHQHLDSRYWCRPAPFQEIGYAEFVDRMCGLIRRHLPLTPAQRFLFRSWLSVRELHSHAIPARAPQPMGAARASGLALSMHSR